MWITQILNNGSISHYYMGYGEDPFEKFYKMFGHHVQEKELITTNYDPR